MEVVRASRLLQGRFHLFLALPMFPESHTRCHDGLSGDSDGRFGVLDRTRISRIGRYFLYVLTKRQTCQQTNSSF